MPVREPKPMSDPPQTPGFCWLISTNDELLFLGGYTADKRWVLLSVHAEPSPAPSTCTHWCPIESPFTKPFSYSAT